jgi:hypothetical protein
LANAPVSAKDNLGIGALARCLSEHLDRLGGAAGTGPLWIPVISQRRLVLSSHALASHFTDHPRLELRAYGRADDDTLQQMDFSFFKCELL